MWSVESGVVISDLDSIYAYADDDCILVFYLSDPESKGSIEVIEPEPPEHVKEVISKFSIDWTF